METYSCKNRIVRVSALPATLVFMKLWLEIKQSTIKHYFAYVVF